MDRNVLNKVGLTDCEVEVYLTLLKSEEALASEISGKTAISRTYIYDSIKTLIEKGLISYVIKNNRKYFKAANPEKLLEYMEEKENRLLKQKKEIGSIIPELKKLCVPVKEKPIVEIYEGKEGLKTALNDIIKEGKEVFAWGATAKIKEYLPEFVIRRYLKEREEKGIKAIQLFAEGTEVLETPMSKFIPIPKEYTSPVTVAVYGSKVIIFFWAQTPVVIMIKSKEIAQSFRKHLKFLLERIKS